MQKSSFVFALLSLTIPFGVKADVKLVELAKKVRPAVVLIETFDKENNPLGQGSGFFINDKNHIVTNHHVIEGAYSGNVTTTAGNIYPVKGIIAKDAEADIVELLVDATDSKVTVLKLANVLPFVGEDIVVVGNPFGLESTVSRGIVSAVREIPAFGHIVQISAPVSQGSSGSPVLNMKGQVVGVATFIMSEGQALNFAIPSEKILGLKIETKPIKLSEYVSAVMSKEMDEVERLYKVGWENVLAGKWLEALDYFNGVVREKPNHEGAHFSLGFVYNTLSRYEEAVNAYKQAVAINPTDADNHYFLGEAYTSLGHYEKAIEAYKRAIAINPADADTRYALGVVYYIKDDIESALQEYKTLKMLDEESAAQLFALIYEQNPLSPSDDTDTSKPFLYHNSQGHFSFTVPAGWEEIPKDIIDEYFKAMQGLSTQELSFENEYDIAFQRTSKTYFTYPYIMFQIDKSKRILESEIEEYLFSNELEEVMEKGLQEVEDALPYLIQNLNIGQKQYDKNKNIIFLKMESEVFGVGKISNLTAIFLSNYGTVNIFCYSIRENFEDDLPYFTQIIDSFKFDAGHAYGLITKDTKDNYPIRNNSGNSLRNIGFAVFAGCILVTIIIIIIAKRSTDKTIPLTEKVTRVEGQIYSRSPSAQTFPVEEGDKIEHHEFKSDISTSQKVSEKSKDSSPVILGYFQECANCTRTIGKLEHSYMIEGNIVCVKCYQILSSENS